MPYTGTVLDKLIAVAEVLDQQRDLSDISHRAGVTKGTAHRMLAKMIACGWAERVPGRNRGWYGPTDKLRQLGGPAPQPAQTSGLVVPLPAQSYVLVPAEWFVQHQAGRCGGAGAGDSDG